MQLFDINQGDSNGYTPLAWAARNGYDEMVKMLLGWETVNPDKPNNSGQTPLSLAACYGHEGVVRLLLDRQDVNPENLDIYNRTPPWFAALILQITGALPTLTGHRPFLENTRTKSHRSP